MDFVRPSVRLGQPKDIELQEFKELNIDNQIKIYVHHSILNLDERYNPQIDVEWKLFGKGLLIRGI